MEFVRRYQKIKEFLVAAQNRRSVTVLIQENHQIDWFKQQLRDSLQRETINARAITIAKNMLTCTRAAIPGDGLLH